MDNFNQPSVERSSGEGTLRDVQEELRELRQINYELRQTLAILDNKVSRQDNLLREMREEFSFARPDAEPVDRLYDTDQLARRWGVSKRTIETEVAEGNLVPTYIRGTRRFTLDAIRAYERAASGSRRHIRRRAAMKSSSRRRKSPSEGKAQEQVATSATRQPVKAV